MEQQPIISIVKFLLLYHLLHHALQVARLYAQHLRNPPQRLNTGIGMASLDLGNVAAGYCRDT